MPRRQFCFDTRHLANTNASKLVEDFKKNLIRSLLSEFGF